MNFETDVIADERQVGFPERMSPLRCALCLEEVRILPLEARRKACSPVIALTAALLPPASQRLTLLLQRVGWP
jgi:hypothetical protein